MTTITSKTAVRDAEHISSATIVSAGWGLFFIWVGIALAIDVGWGSHRGREVGVTNARR